MAMNNSNYGYPPSGFSSPYSSTPSGMRTQRPRFGYSGPSLYPRPRSSASKPNPDSFSDSMINNYGNSTRIDPSFSSENGNSYNDSYANSSSNYYSANDTFYSDSPRGDTSLLCGESGLMRGDAGLLRDDSLMYGDTMRGSSGMMRGDKSLGYGDMQNSGILPNPTSSFGPPKYLHNNSTFNTNSIGEYKGNYQKKLPSSSFGFGDKNNKLSFTARKFGKAKRRMAPKQQGTWRCELCSLDFTSQIPYDMHVRGARHAKKLKAKEALTAVQSQAVVGPDGEKSFFCELCNVKANSSLQLQTHLEGSKHKNKLQPKDQPQQKNTTEEKTDANSNANVDADASVNGKTNGSVTRPLPSDFGEPQPAKLTKFACDVCSISVNSEIQLQQHLSSKKHQNKLEGKPVVRRRKSKMENKEDTADTADTVMTDADPEQASSKTVVGVKALASSFVQGGTLQ